MRVCRSEKSSSPVPRFCRGSCRGFLRVGSVIRLRRHRQIEQVVFKPKAAERLVGDGGEMLLGEVVIPPVRYNGAETDWRCPGRPGPLGTFTAMGNYNFTKEHFPAIADQTLRRFRLEDDLFLIWR